MPRPTGIRMLLSAAAVVGVAGLAGLSVLAMPGCSREQDAGSRAAVERVDLYTGIRGQIVDIPDQARAMSSFKVAHEHIPDFRNRAGEVHTNMDGVPGMKAMTMGFELSQGVSLEGFEVSDEIEFDWEMVWLAGDRRRIVVTRIEHLPEGESVDLNTLKTAPGEQDTPDTAPGADPAADAAG